MNILVIDIGNTRIKWGLAEDGSWLRQGWVLTAQPAELGKALTALPLPDRILISNVAGASAQAKVAAVLPVTAQPVRWLVSAAQQCGVSSGYVDPAALGPDRWAALIGAWHLTGCACVVVNAGTTMTVDALNSEGVFLGGCIVPGAALMRDALARDTANLAQRAGAFSYFPDNTGDAIFSGTVNALSGAVAQVVQYLQQSSGTAPRVLLSGGDASLIEARINGKVTVVDNLVLEGLLQIARQAD